MIKIRGKNFFVDVIPIFAVGSATFYFYESPWQAKLKVYHHGTFLICCTLPCKSTFDPQSRKKKSQLIRRMNILFYYFFKVTKCCKMLAEVRNFAAAELWCTVTVCSLQCKTRLTFRHGCLSVTVMDSFQKFSSSPFFFFLLCLPEVENFSCWNRWYKPWTSLKTTCLEHLKHFFIYLVILREPKNAWEVSGRDFQWHLLEH